MLAHRHWDRQSADQAEIPLRPLVPLTVQLLVLELGRASLACLLVLLAVGPLAVHAAVLDEAAGRAVLELDSVASVLAAVGARFAVILGNGYAAHDNKKLSLELEETIGTEGASGRRVRKLHAVLSPVVGTRRSPNIELIRAESRPA
ncbi:hypothetical protein THAOC_32832 [Thalassiosira oceanica]|uniref:Uncharacterized protein n=1 Tax=Thalassiosira oceanica TaxID=159749 RepID=K0RHF4_THAOC|nr:hypothetical protein THAOC_32832 [Thalassiosira oceanica]|eukprot:EJK48376.1 hypothetical protein THAOC_32832 [Thalassiosira oceanica]